MIATHFLSHFVVISWDHTFKVAKVNNLNLILKISAQKRYKIDFSLKFLI